MYGKLRTKKGREEVGDKQMVGASLGRGYRRREGWIVLFMPRDRCRIMIIFFMRGAE